MSKWKPDICIYHAPCDDGFAAAWCVWKKWGSAVDFRPSNYGQPVPNHEIDGKNVLIVDFSFKPDVLIEMGERAATVVVLDHHKTAREDLQSFLNLDNLSVDRIDQDIQKAQRIEGTNIIVQFDMERSGAMMTWNFCFPGVISPPLITVVQDRDLWKFQIQNTKLVTLYLRSFDYDFTVWDIISDLYDRIPDQLLVEARAIKRFFDKKVSEISETATIRKIGEFNVPVVSAPYAFVSDVGHKLLEDHPAAAFVAITIDAHEGRTYSLRSDDGRQDVSEIARLYGGGGHRNAAGFRVPS